MIRGKRGLCVLACCTLLISVGAQFVPVDINAGSASDVDDIVSGNLFHKYVPSPTPAISNTDDPARYASHRSGLQGQSFTYNIDAPAGSYEVILGFAEVWSPNCQPGKRVFNVVANGNPVLSNYDAYVAAGEVCYAAVTETFDVDVSDGQPGITLAFVAVTENAFVSSIEISGSGMVTPPPTASTTTTTAIPDGPVTTSTTTTSTTTAGDGSDTTSTTTDVPDGPVTASTTTTVADAPVTTSTTTTVSDAPVTTTTTTTAADAPVTTSTTTTIAEPSTQPLPTDAGPGVVVYDIDAGSATDSDSLVSGASNKFSPGLNAIAGTSDPLRYSSHRWGVNGGPFSYELSVSPSETVTVELGFAEIWIPACDPGSRVFSVFANGVLVIDSLDVAVVAGCKEAHLETFAVDIGADGLLTLTFGQPGGSQSPFVSSIVVRSDVSGPSISPSASPSPTMTAVSDAPVTTSTTTTIAEPSTQPLPTDAGPGVVVYDIDAGSATDSDSLVSGASNKFSPGLNAIAGTSDPLRYSSHRWGVNGGPFSYELSVSPSETVTVELGFAEIWIPACDPGSRVFSVFANGVLVIDSLDVAVVAGCKEAHLETFAVDIGADGLLTLTFGQPGGSQSPFVSSIVVRSDGVPGPTPTPDGPTPTPDGPTPTPVVEGIFVDAGGADDPGAGSLGGTSNAFSSGSTVGGTANGVPFQSHRYGVEFSYTFDVPAAVYDITLGFNENYNPNCQNSSRVFSVLLNDLPLSSLFTNLDVYKETQLCNTPLTRSVRVPVSGTLKLSFVATLDSAFVSSISIDPVEGCIFAGSNSGNDHRAHSVPGSYPDNVQANAAPAYIDADGDGFHSVTIDGFKSHTHYQDNSDPANPTAGFIQEWKWTNLESGEVVSTEQQFTADFPRGTTRLLLEVVDNTCDRSEAETSVTVAGVISEGAYCYYYDTSATLLGGGLATETNKPVFAYERTGSFSGSLQTPPFSSSGYAVRCQFFYEVSSESEVSTVSVSTGGSGSAIVYKGSDLLLDTDTGVSSAGTPMSSGLISFEVLYFHTSGGSPSLGLQVNGTDIAGTDISYDRGAVVPILSAITPNEVPESGGQVLVAGYGFFLPPIVSFGTAFTATANTQELTLTSFTVDVPAMEAGQYPVSAKSSSAGINGNSLLITVGDVFVVAFDQAVVKESNGKNANSKVATCITLWGDSWYLGSLFGRVHKLTVSPDLVVQSQCFSPIFEDPAVSKDGVPARVDILGIAFSPSDTVGMPYVAVQTLYWFYSGRVDPTNDMAWRNGRIERLKDDNSDCLVIDERVVSGLPVSDHDHGVNGVEFDNNGDLYVAVGGSTNGGLGSSPFGFAWETPLSAAILKVKLSLGESFNGEVEYDREYADHRNAQKTAGDVETYCTGLRNSFDLVFTSQERIFATDNGPNKNFGRYSTECGQDVNDGVPEFTRPDRIVECTEGSFHGHPNLNRGECQYIDPFTDKDALGRDPLPELNYQDEVSTMKSSVNGIIEYTAGHFGGLLKGELIATSYAPSGIGAVFRQPIDGPLQTLDPEYGGLSIAQGFFGELIFPRLKWNAQFIHVLQPKYPIPTGLATRVVTPFRGGSAGGLVVTITGHGFGAGSPSVTFNGNSCAVVAGSVTETSRGSLLKCTTPANVGGAKLVDVVVSLDGSSSVLSNGFMYAAV